MDRINGADTTDIGSGRRGFRAENLVAGVAGTEVTAEWLNGIQEEILRVVTEAGLTPNSADWSQLWQALKALGLSSAAKSRRWMAVISMSLSSAPGSPAEGDAYLIPAGATGIWAAKVGQIAEWTGAAWTYFTPTDGHGIALPDGRVFERLGGSYVEKIALDVQSGKWAYAVAGGTANALTASLSPKPSALVDGLRIVLLPTAANTGAATLNVNEFGAVPIRRPGGGLSQVGDIFPNVPLVLVYAQAQWFIVGLPVPAGGFEIYQTPGTFSFTVPSGVFTLSRVRLWGGGAGGRGGTTSTVGTSGGGGAYADISRVPVTPGQVIPLTVGAGGAAGAVGESGANGGTSAFGVFASAPGGNRGESGSGGAVTAAPTISGVIGFGLPGGRGYAGSIVNSVPSSGPGGASPFGGGIAAATASSGGIGGNAPGGGGSGGGMGSSGNIGGAGAPGMIIVEY